MDLKNQYLTSFACFIIQLLSCCSWFLFNFLNEYIVPAKSACFPKPDRCCAQNSSESHGHVVPERSLFAVFFKKKKWFLDKLVHVHALIAEVYSPGQGRAVWRELCGTHKHACAHLAVRQRETLAGVRLLPQFGHTNHCCACCQRARRRVTAELWAWRLRSGVATERIEHCLSSE